MSSRPRLRNLLVDAVRYAPGRLAPALTSAIMVLMATRVLPPAAMGVYAIIITSILLLSSLAVGWLNQSALRYYSRYSISGNDGKFVALHRVLAGLSGLTVVVFAVACVATFGVPPGISAFGFILASSLILMTSLADANQSLLMARGDAFGYSLSEAVRTTITLGIAAILVIKLQATVELFLLSSLVGTTVGAALSILRGGAGTSWARSDVREYAMIAGRFGFPLMGWFLAIQILGVGDRYIINSIRGAAEVGIYSANIQMLPSLFTIAMAPLIMAAHPILMRTANSAAPQLAERTITEYTRYYVIWGGLVASALIAAFSPLTRILIGPAFWAGAIVAPLGIVALFAWNLGLYGHKRFEIAEKPTVMLGYVAICALISLVLNLVLVPGLGFVGAAVAAALAYSCYPILVHRSTKAPIRWKFPRATGLRVLGAALLAIASGWGVAYAARSLSPFLASPMAMIVAVAAFGIALFALREFTIRELRMLRSLHDESHETEG